ncbi:MAG: lipopolysaccharide biosynthesis protein, partial [bacterium]
MLKQKAKIAVLWSAADIFLRQGLQFGVSIALARLLSPEEFGTIALLYLFTGVASAFVDSGFSAALIQKKDISKTDESTVFWFNLLIGAFVAVCLWAISPIISKFYNIPILIPLMAVMALNIFISALGSIHGTLLTRQLDFKTLMKVSAVATSFSGATAVILAINNFGIWALAAQTLMATSVTTVMLWMLNKWRPSLIFSIDSARRLFSFGGYMLASSLLNIIYGRAYSLVIGKFYGVSDLAFYNRAESTIGLPTGILSSILSRVAFPIFSEAAKNNEKLYRGSKFAVQNIMYINIPIMLGLAVVAEPVVQTLFGSKWLPSVPVMQVLCIGGVLWPLHVINLDILKSQGHSKIFFRLELIKIGLGILALSIGAFFGVIGIAWSTVLLSGLSFFVNAYYTKKFLSYGALEQILDVLPAFVISLITAMVVRVLYLM